MRLETSRGDQSSSCRKVRDSVQMHRLSSIRFHHSWDINKLPHECCSRFIICVGNIEHFWHSLLVDGPFRQWRRIILFHLRVDLCNRAQCFIEADHYGCPADGNRWQLWIRGGVQCRFYHGIALQQRRWRKYEADVRLIIVRQWWDDLDHYYERDYECSDVATLQYLSIGLLWRV